MMTYREFADAFYPDELDGNLISEKYAEHFLANAAVGEGATVHYYTDAEAYTIIARTPKTITLRRDKATLKKDYHPIRIPGGFAGHCINNEDQEYDYEEDPKGRVVTAYWSDRKKGFYVQSCLHVTPGRSEYYDFNF